MDSMKSSVSLGTTGSRQPILDSNNTEEIPVQKKPSSQDVSLIQNYIGTEQTAVDEWFDGHSTVMKHLSLIISWFKKYLRERFTFESLGFF